MEDQRLHKRIEEPVAEEHDLYHREELGADEHERLERLRVSLDQCWDLLRQRRALRGAGLDPDDAGVRSEEVVEHYRQ